MTDSRNVTDDGEGRYRLYRLCECTACGGTGKETGPIVREGTRRCGACRGEGRTRELVASATDPQAVGVALVTLALEGEWDDGCPFGLLDSEGETGKKWLISPWRPSARNVSDAARTLRNAQKGREQ